MVIFSVSAKNKGTSTTQSAYINIHDNSVSTVSQHQVQSFECVGKHKQHNEHIRTGWDIPGVASTKSNRLQITMNYSSM